MDIDSIRRHCLEFPHTTENVQWGATLCFKLDGKLFVVAALDPGPVRLSFKCTPESFVELCERPGVRPAPYMARAQWVGLEQLNAIADSELRDLIAESYRLVWERLPKKRQSELSAAKTTVKPSHKAAKTARKAAKPTRKSAAKPKGRSAKKLEKKNNLTSKIATTRLTGKHISPKPRRRG
jgi:predicted DNA-binding protein (MmcQ/YjbR family)